MLDPDLCYRALASRDARFDGRFFTAVVTTGIYCRPVCPARTPKQRNVRFYTSAAAAEEAGFRPCRRCRPESSPGTPPWDGTSTTVARGLALIARGALDTGSVEDLAVRLGIGERHLRRLFLEHVGATPVALAQTRRAHFAKRLIDETALPITEIGLASGYASLRRFNAAIRGTFGGSARELRREAREGGVPAGREGTIALRLPFRAPLDWGALLGFLARRAIPGVEEVDGEGYGRTIALGAFRGRIRVRPPRAGEAHALLEVPGAASRSLLAIADRVRRLFDLDADPLRIGAQLSRDPLLARILRAHPGIRVPGAWDGFELAVRAVLGQQVSVRAATTLAGRLVRQLAEPIAADGDGGPRFPFPPPAVVAEADLSSLGIPAQRRSALRALARAVRDGELDLEGGEITATFARLRAIPGIGAWTAEYVAMRALREPDAFRADDLVLRRSISAQGTLMSARSLAARAEAWRPWRAYAAVALWAATPPRRTARGRGTRRV